jgi:hypothetical protein
MATKLFYIVKQQIYATSRPGARRIAGLTITTHSGQLAIELPMLDDF